MAETNHQIAVRVVSEAIIPFVPESNSVEELGPEWDDLVGKIKKAIDEAEERGGRIDRRVAFVEEDLVGTCKTLREVCSVSGYDEDEIAAAMTGDIEECHECGWWCEACEMLTGKDGESRCDDCRSGGD